MFLSINPYTEKQIGHTSCLSQIDLQKKLDLSDRAFSHWNTASLNKKKEYVLNLKELLKKDPLPRAKLISQEMGKPLKQSLAEINKCQTLCEWSVERAKFALRDEKNLTSSPSFACYRPLGVILGIMPWNFPYWQVFRFAITTLFGGNCVLIKHAPNVMGCAKELETLFLNAGFPDGVYQNLSISVEQTKALIAHRIVKGVSLTGSVRAGSSVSSLAGKYIKKSILELGGTDPYLVLEDADLDLASTKCVRSRMNNNGQSCIAAKRWIVNRKVFSDFKELSLQKLKAFKMGNPLSLNTRLGPLAREDLRTILHKQVSRLVNQKNVQLILGAKIPKKKKGYFYPPTLIQIPHTLPIEEEFFGPVALITCVENDEQAIEASNLSPYGLGGAIFSKNVKKAKHLARVHLHAGGCAINEELHSHPALPFGGVKDSGFGRELSEQGFRTFMNLKTIFFGST